MFSGAPVTWHEPVAETAPEEQPAEDAGGEAHEGESVVDRPDAPSTTDEAAGDDTESGESEQT